MVGVYSAYGMHPSHRYKGYLWGGGVFGNSLHRVATLMNSRFVPAVYLFKRHLRDSLA